MNITLPEAHKQFRQYFPDISFRDYLDGFMSLATHEVKIDIWKFDTWLHKKHGVYEMEGLNMKELLDREYGRGAAAFIESLI